ncbi:calpain-2 (C02 family) [Schistosoma mansoni]|uniref:Calpain-2 (C02 family) n=1 Tax=Schistosoma mansoni TaxID=6183 RepID=G4V6E4_SCHMA|nr:calpain-2 (C02 family) [Schistosoma mansoni]|eukprot:XP_018648626.1 calpain-2 (C02 family) [Schistosoma mansoni]
MSSTTKHFVQLAGQNECMTDRLTTYFGVHRVLTRKSNNHIGGVHVGNNTKRD